jgi:hypothetical protein
MAGLFIGLRRAHMGADADRRVDPRSWTIDQAEALLNSLTGVMSARLVARPGGVIDEIHLLTTKEVSAKQAVRNVESALLAHFDLKIDHRKVSVAQTDDEGPGEGDAKVLRHPARRMEDRLLFVAHQVETERSLHARFKVTVEVRGERYEGEAAGADLARARNETAAAATLKAVEAAVAASVGEGEVSLPLDGVKVIEAFDQTFVLVAIHAIHGRAITALAGAAAIDETSDRAVILATLQAVDRWVRGRI